MTEVCLPQSDFERDFRIALLNAPPAFFVKVQTALCMPLYPSHNDAVVGKLVRDLVNEFSMKMKAGR